MNIYKLTLKHDGGKINIVTTACDGQSWANIYSEFYRQHVNLKTNIYEEFKRFRNSYFTILKGHILTV